MGDSGLPPEGVIKRSLAIAGHRTSVSLEYAFWDALRDIAGRRGLPIAALVTAIDRGRGNANLSSAIRVFVLDDARTSFGRADGARHDEDQPGADRAGGDRFR